MRGTTWRQADDRGASAVEYGLLVAAIAAIIVAVVFAIGTATGTLFKDSCTKIANGDNQTTTTSTNCGP